MQTHHSTRLMDWAQTCLFVSLLIGVGVLFIFWPKDEISEGEKRKLAQMPAFSWASLGEGAYMKGLDDFVADNFVFRYVLTDIAGQIKQWRGRVQDDIEVFSDKGHPKAHAKDPGAGTSAPPTGSNDQDPQSGSASTEGAVQSRTALAQDGGKLEGVGRLAGGSDDSAANPLAARVNDEAPYQNIESIIIYKGRAVQMLGGGPQMAASFASVLARYQQELPQTTIYFMGIPIGADFYLPQKVNKGVMREKMVIDHMHSLMPQQVRAVHAYEKLAQHVSEYLYFNTDHHWTGLGAYYAYTAFAEAAHWSPLALSDFTKKEIPDFLGTLYHRTLSPVLKAKGDKVEYYKVPVNTTAKFYPAGSKQGQPTQLYAEYARGGGAYGVFLGGDYPMMKITSDVKNGRKIVVVKDSYGNALAPYFAAHYEEVYVLDYRHFNGSIKALIQQEGIQELLFAHNPYVFLSGFAAQRARGFLDGAMPAVRKPPASEAAH